MFARTWWRDIFVNTAEEVSSLSSKEVELCLIQIENITPH